MPRPERAATELIVYGVLGVVLAAFLPWEETFDVALNRPLKTGVELGWGVMAAILAIVLLAIVYRYGWPTAVVPTGIIGLALIGFQNIVSMWDNGVDVPIVVDFAGLSIIGALIIATLPSGINRLPTPLAGVTVAGKRIEREWLHGIAVAGGIVILGGLAAAEAVTGGFESFGSLYSWGLVGYPAGLLVLVLIRAWSLPSAAVALLGGSGMAISITNSMLSGDEALRGFVLDGVILLTGGLLLIVAGTLELGGAWRGPAEDIDEHRGSGPAG